MKISKLFHWLYAFLMALPIFAILSACLISTFNMSSKQETEVIYKYETNSVETVRDIVNGNYYKIDTYYLLKYCYDDSLLGVNDYIEIDDIQYNGDLELPGVYTDFDFDNALPMRDSVDIGIYNDGDVNFYINCGDTYNSGMALIDYTQGNYIFYGSVWLSNNNIDLNISSAISECPLDKLPIETVDVNNVETQDIFYNAIDKVKESPLFSWAYDSFLVAPFSYILSLFSMPSNSFVVQMLSYWLAISIIWLVFDLVMYVPLLVHRWLDKGVLE